MGCYNASEERAYELRRHSEQLTFELEQARLKIALIPEVLTNWLRAGAVRDERFPKAFKIIVALHQGVFNFNGATDNAFPIGKTLH
ncbi:MAG: hypothetical protein RMN51_06080 [Verrucomicrobiota bacterium]|nr:hypothetical protein [Limisphaera sp.]MDW8381658.1 hypothetical protein [Verrucomicrobiota bacterium]